MPMLFDAHVRLRPALRGYGGPSWLVTLQVAGQSPAFRNATLAYWLTHYLYDFQAENDVVLHGWVILPNHAHCILQLDAARLESVINHFMIQSALFLKGHTQQKKQFWHSVIQKQILPTQPEFLRALRALFFDPVQHRLVDDPVDYPFSSYHHFLHMHGASLLESFLQRYSKTHRVFKIHHH